MAGETRSTAVEATALDTEFHRGLGLFDSTMVVVGCDGDESPANPDGRVR